MVSERVVQSRGGRVRALVATGTERIGDARTRVPAVDAAWSVWTRDRLMAGSLLAGAIAYRLFLWLLPVALVLTAALGFLGAGGSADAARELGASRYIATTVGDAAEQADRGRWLLLAA